MMKKEELTVSLEFDNPIYVRGFGIIIRFSYDSKPFTFKVSTKIYNP